jgi:hypothetical protein
MSPTRPPPHCGIEYHVTAQHPSRHVVATVWGRTHVVPVVDGPPQPSAPQPGYATLQTCTAARHVRWVDLFAERTRQLVFSEGAACRMCNVQSDVLCCAGEVCVMLIATVHSSSLLMVVQRGVVASRGHASICSGAGA